MTEMVKRKILLIQNLDKSDYIYSVLKEEFQVDVVNKVEDIGHQILEKNIFALVIHVENPLNVIQMYKEDALIPNIPTIVLSDTEDAAVIEELLALGIFDIFSESLSEQLIRKRVRNAVVQDTEIDRITGLYNNVGFLKYAEKQISKNPDDIYYLIRFDIDNFKFFNDIFGWKEGDELLKIIGQACNEWKRIGCVVGRVEKDHFVILMDETVFGMKDLEHNVKEMDSLEYKD